MTASELRRKYIEFFKGKGHAEISGKSLIPENDPTVLFTTAGMHPLVPYILGEPHPAGKRLVDCQKCIRTGDIDEVGDAVAPDLLRDAGQLVAGRLLQGRSHRVLVRVPDLAALARLLRGHPLRDRLRGRRRGAPRTTEAAGDLEVPRHSRRAHLLPRRGRTTGGDRPGRPARAAPTRRCSSTPATPRAGPTASRAASCGKYFEVWNDVFMQYNKTAGGTYMPLAQKNVDTGMGVERTIAMMQGKKTVYETELFAPVIARLQPDHRASRTAATPRRIAPSASSPITCGPPSSSSATTAGVKPSNLGQGYVLRRLIRRSHPPRPEAGPGGRLPRQAGRKASSRSTGTSIPSLRARSAA